MSLINNKRNIFTDISSFTSLSQQENLPNPRDTYSSINNSNNSTMFIIEVLKITVGSLALKQITGELLTDFLDTTEPKLKTALKKQFIQPKSDTLLPNSFVNGLKVPVKNIDIYNKFKTNPNSDIGKILYDSQNNTYDKNMYDAINSEGTEIGFNNLKFSYNNDNESITFKPTINNITVNDWFNEYIDNAEILNRKEFTTKVMDSLYGTATSNQNKTLEQIKKELEINETLDKISNGNENLILNEDELCKIFQDAEDLSNGIISYDMGCGLIKTELKLDDMTDLIDDILNTNDPNQVSNIIEESIFNNARGTDLNKNSETIKDYFFISLINSIKFLITSAMILSPQARTLTILNQLLRGEQLNDDPISDIDNQKTFIGCISNNISSTINEFLFNKAKISLIKLLTPAIKKIAREKINQYINLIKSLII